MLNGDGNGPCGVEHASSFLSRAPAAGAGRLDASFFAVRLLGTRGVNSVSPFRFPLGVPKHSVFVGVLTKSTPRMSSAPNWESTCIVPLEAKAAFMIAGGDEVDDSIDRDRLAEGGDLMISLSMTLNLLR